MPRPRNFPPVNVPQGCKYCFKCCSVLPHDDYAKDASAWDGKKRCCRRCDTAAATIRDQRLRLLRRIERDVASLSTELNRLKVRSSRKTLAHDHCSSVSSRGDQRPLQGLYL